MILTLTANPSLDRTVRVPGTLVPGAVHRISRERTQPGGKGINVALGVHRAGLQTRALFPASPSDPLVALVRETGLDFRTSALPGPVRTNLAIVDADGVTTKVNEPGPHLDAEHVAALEDLLTSSITPGDHVMLSGSLAPGFAPGAYRRLVEAARAAGAWVGVDTSDAPLVALAESFPASAPDFLKPNAHELGQILGLDGDGLEEAAGEGDYAPVVAAATRLREQGVSSVLVTLGGAGALLATADGAWVARTARVQVLSTVGAGDSATAGYLIALARGEGPAERLAAAASYGTAAVTLPGTTIPTPEEAARFPATITAL
ncbi:MAG: 1-phosphofructokinase family hexose kinase [Dermabacter sp.]|nr:1-phosphofructokinase family hexose kinase [Dermabacter sp.]